MISPRSGLRRPEMALSVVLFPAPLEPSRVTMRCSGTSREIPLRTRMTRSYTTSTLFSRSMPLLRRRLVGVVDLLDLGHDHIAVSAEPVGRGHPLLAPDLVEPHPASALVVIGGDRHR